MNIVFSVFIDIPEAKLDNPGYYIDNILVDTNKSLETKNALLNNADELKRRHKEYADSIWRTDNGAIDSTMFFSTNCRGCIDPNACNYDSIASYSDSSCYYMPSINMLKVNM